MVIRVCCTLGRGRLVALSFTFFLICLYFFLSYHLSVVSFFSLSWGDETKPLSRGIIKEGYLVIIMR